MGQVNLKLSKINDTLEDFDICEEDREIIRELLEFERDLSYIEEFAKNLDRYGSRHRKRVRAVFNIEYEIRKLRDSSAIYPYETLDKELIKLAKHVNTKAQMIFKALEILKDMKTLKEDPVWDMVQMMYDADFDVDDKRLRKLIKQHVLKVIAGASEKPEADRDELSSQDLEDESATPVTVDLVVGILDLDKSSDEAVYFDDGITTACIIKEGRISSLRIRNTKGVDSNATYDFAIKGRPTSGSTIDKQTKIAENLALFINEMMELSTCRAVDLKILKEKYGLEDECLTTMEPEDDKNAFFDNARRLSIYVGILTAGNVFQCATANIFNGYKYKNNTNGVYSLDQELSEVEEFDAGFDPSKLLANMLVKSQPIDE